MEAEQGTGIQGDGQAGRDGQAWRPGWERSARADLGHPLHTHARPATSQPPDWPLFEWGELASAGRKDKWSPQGGRTEP